MNELAIRSFGTPAAAQAYKAALLRTARKVDTGGDDTPILKIGKTTGEWTFGEDNDYVERNDLWAVHPIDIKHGYIAFDGRSVAQTLPDRDDDDDEGERAEMLFPVTEELPHYDDLPRLDIRSKKRDGKTGWQFQMAIRLVCVEGDNKGATVVWKPTSKGGLRAIGKIANEILRKMDEDDRFVPVVELDHRPYTSKEYGPQVQPLLHIVEWASLEDTEFSSGRSDESEDDTKSRKSRSRDDRGGNRGKGTRDSKARGKADSGRDSGERGRGRDGDDAREDARESRKEERTARGDKVDQRRSREAVDTDEDGPDDRTQKRMRDRHDDNEAADARSDEPKRGRRDRDDDAQTEEREAPRGRRGRDRDEEPADEGRGRRSARSRYADDGKDEGDAPRGRRGRDAEDDGASRKADARRGRDEDSDRNSRDDAPRGRNAARGGRNRDRD